MNVDINAVSYAPQLEKNNENWTPADFRHQSGSGRCVNVRTRDLCSWIPMFIPFVIKKM